MGTKKVKNYLTVTIFALAASSAFAQTTDGTTGGTTQTTQSTTASTSGAQSGAMAIGGGLGTSTLNSTIGGSTTRNSNRINASGGNGGNGQGGSGTSNVTVNLGTSATDPSGTGANGTAAARDQTTAAATDPVNRSDIHETIKTTGNPGSMSFATSFSQFNCANSGGIGAGWLGGVFNIGGPLESGPCNARANANALAVLAQAVPADNPLRGQLVEAAIRLIANSTSATMDALKDSNVAFFTPKPEPKTSDVQPGAETTATKQPGAYAGTDPLIISRMGLQRVSADNMPANQPKAQPAVQTTPQQTTQSEQAEATPVPLQSATATPLK